MMKRPDPLDNPEMKRLQCFIYLIPIMGVFPALWTLYRNEGSRDQRAASRWAVLLTLGWIFGYILLGAGAQSGGTSALPLLILSSLLTSGYFLVNIWLMVRLWQRKSLQLPRLGALGDRPRQRKGRSR